MSKKIQWNGALQQEGLVVLSLLGGLIVSPTKVGYILIAADLHGLKRKFDAKQRKKTKPAVLLCGSMDEFMALAEYDETILKLYQMHWDQDVLLGCILPWSEQGKKRLVQAGTEELATDGRATSCFVIKFGLPSEKIAAAMWDQGRILFASSANPSGLGNKGKVAGIGERIEQAADLVICADDYVSSIQPDKNESSRYAQGVMLSFVDDQGHLISDNSAPPYPALIRKGLDVDKIMLNLSTLYDRWDYRQGDYY